MAQGNIQQNKYIVVLKSYRVKPGKYNTLFFSHKNLYRAFFFFLSNNNNNNKTELNMVKNWSELLFSESY